MTLFETTSAAFPLNYIMNASTLKNINKITDDEMESVYAMAYNFYTHGSYEKALDAFTSLCLLDHTEIKHWVGLGASAQMQKKFAEAADAYNHALILNPQDPQIHRYLVDSFLALKDSKKAIQHLKSTLMTCEDNPDHAKLKTEAENLLEILKRNA